MKDALVRIDALSKSFGGLPVLRGVDLSVMPGRVMAIVGPNGAGKTTLIKSVLGLVHPDAGTIAIGGTSIVDNDSYRAHIGYMPQIARFPENLTGAELIAMLKDLRGRGASSTTSWCGRWGSGTRSRSRSACSRGAPGRK